MTLKQPLYPPGGKDHDRKTRVKLIFLITSLNKRLILSKY